MTPHYLPRCVRPVSETTAADYVEQQTVRILDLDGKLVNALARIVDLERDLHDANNHATPFQSAVQLIALLLGMDADAPPLDVVAAAKARLR